MQFDSHVHSMASPDSEMNPGEAIAALKSKGYGTAFTEHVDYATPQPGQNPHAQDAPRGIGDFVCDFGIYPALYKKYRGEGVLLGLEFGLTAAYLQVNKQIIAAGDYDFIIGAIHGVDGLDIFNASKTAGAGSSANSESSADSVTSGTVNNPDGGIARYLTYAREMVELADYFDAFAHIDYIARYVPVAAEKFSYGNYPEEFDALLKALAEREIALEINTSRFLPDSKLNVPDAGQVMFEICKRFAELGGRYCTIGSDAHTVATLARNFDTAHAIAENSGLTTVYYRERIPVPCGK